MITNFIHSASGEEIATIYNMPADEMQKLSADLSLGHTAMFAYIPNRQPSGLPIAGADGSIDINRISRELQIRVTDEPQGEQEYILGPYSLAGKTALRGIALWLANAEQPIREPRVWLKGELATR